MPASYVVFLSAKLDPMLLIDHGAASEPARHVFSASVTKQESTCK